MKKIVHILILFLSCAGICHAQNNEKIMLTLNEIPTTNKIETYTKVFKEVLLKELASHQYNKGFDFSDAAITFNDGTGYVAPKYYGELSTKPGEIYYVPQNVKFERSFQLYFTEYEGKVEIEKRDTEADLYFSPQEKDYEKAMNIINSYHNKGIYPGQAYFQTEIDQVNRSLKSHQAFIKKQFSASEYRIRTEAADSLAEVNKTIYQVSSTEVYIRTWGNIPVKFFYKIETGVITDVQNVPPPGLE